jgi:hypothetical protein
MQGDGDGGWAPAHASRSTKGCGGLASSAPRLPQRLAYTGPGPGESELVGSGAPALLLPTHGASWAHCARQPRLGRTVHVSPNRVLLLQAATAHRPGLPAGRHAATVTAGALRLARRRAAQQPLRWQRWAPGLAPQRRRPACLRALHNDQARQLRSRRAHAAALHVQMPSGARERACHPLAATSQPHHGGLTRVCQ